MKIYIDKEYKCYPRDDGTLREIDVKFFDDKCKVFIEGYRYIPNGETWIRKDGIEFDGEMISPWKPYDQLALAQEAYEEAEEITKIITGEVSINDEG